MPRMPSEHTHFAHIFGHIFSHIFFTFPKSVLSIMTEGPLLDVTFFHVFSLFSQNFHVFFVTFFTRFFHVFPDFSTTRHRWLFRNSEVLKNTFFWTPHFWCFWQHFFHTFFLFLCTQTKRYAKFRVFLYFFVIFFSSFFHIFQNVFCKTHIFVFFRVFQIKPAVMTFGQKVSKKWKNVKKDFSVRFWKNYFRQKKLR